MLENLVQVVGLLGVVAAAGYAVLVVTGWAAMPAWLGQTSPLKVLRHDQALEILRARLARGEITTEEFDSVRRSLEMVR